MFEILDFLILDAEVEDKSIGGFENQRLLLTASFLSSAQKGESRVVCLNLRRGRSVEQKSKGMLANLR